MADDLEPDQAFLQARERVLAAMSHERRVATDEELDELEKLWFRWEVWGLEGLEYWPAEGEIPHVWEMAEVEFRRIPPPPAYIRVHPDDLATLRGASPPQLSAHQGRPYEPLPTDAVKSVVGLLQKRESHLERLGGAQVERGSGLSYDAIASAAGLSRHRVEQIRTLMAEGWDVSRESHPDFPAAAGTVNLPTLAELQRLRRSGRWPS
jgi:hypothetical protein